MDKPIADNFEWFTDEYVIAKTHWLWTKEAEKRDHKRRVGEKVWPHYEKEAPAQWLQNGLIVDAEDYAPEGQLDLLDFV